MGGRHAARVSFPTPTGVRLPDCHIATTPLFSTSPKTRCLWKSARRHGPDGAYTTGGRTLTPHPEAAVKRFALSSVLALGTLTGAAYLATADEGEFVKLFPDDGIPKGWVVTEWNDLSKPAPKGVEWTVKDGVLTTGKKRGTWLVSEKEYTDFVLEFEIT